MRVYISGPMTGIPNKNKEAFDAAEHWLLRYGFDPVNPVAKPNEILTRDSTEDEYKQLLKEDIYEILYNKGGVKQIWVLPGWWRSVGAKREMMIAEWFSIPIYFVPEWVFTNVYQVSVDPEEPKVF